MILARMNLLSGIWNVDIKWLRVEVVVELVVVEGVMGELVAIDLVEFWVI